MIHLASIYGGTSVYGGMVWIFSIQKTGVRIKNILYPEFWLPDSIFCILADFILLSPAGLSRAYASSLLRYSGGDPGSLLPHLFPRYAIVLQKVF